MTASHTPADHIGDANKMVPATMPSEEEVEAEIRPMSYEGADLTECVARTLALFAPILAEKERAERNRDMWKGQCERQAKTLFDLRMQMLADEGQSRAATPEDNGA